MGQHPVPKFRLRARHDIVCLGQLLKIIRTALQWIVVELHGPDLHHVQEDLRILGIILVLTVVQSFAGAGQRY